MQLPTITAASSLLLVPLIVKGALACSAYTYCHCYDSNGTVNVNATGTVCNRYNYKDSTAVMVSDECQYTGKERRWVGKLWVWYGFSNCDFRELCAEAGATGDDSSCREKPGGAQGFAPHS
ncbi:uncharacterized protein LY79DRAFT_525416 [Colletotrichum navitas]|uniref:Uncharacterized protein n=1 Tax=Colletotrichum navitas TaxID=681940 RepID=A0AAD8PNV3_9PEZI|nr:uncharacterized protein LY79DRAFT_525416 [Colletotrichum navitas]KAK1573639.1 hypothetical protein LY79DRAFT_525416 [Colletotrichum navitas]